MREEIWWLINKTYPRVVQLSTYADSILQISYQKAHTTISEKWKIIAQLMSNRYTKQLPSLIPECSLFMPAFRPIWSCLPSNWWTCSVPLVFIWGVWLWPPDPNPPTFPLHLSTVPALAKNSVPSTHSRRPTTVCNSCPGRSNALFWPLQAQHAHGLIKNKCTHKNKTHFF